MTSAVAFRVIHDFRRYQRQWISSGLALKLVCPVPVGPWAYRINPETSRIENQFVTERFSIRNANGFPVNTTPFVDPAYADVSAVMACSMDRSNEATLPLDVIHNHVARVRVPERILGSTGDEWMTDPVGTAGEEMDLRRLEATV
jgi:type I restriction enzyme S subunit